MNKQQIIVSSASHSCSSIKDPKTCAKLGTDNSPLQNQANNKFQNNQESLQYEELDSQRALVKNEYENTFQYLSSLHKSPNDFDDPQNSQRQLVYRQGSESIDGSIEQQVHRKIQKINQDQNTQINIFLNIGQKLFNTKDDKKTEIHIYDQQNNIQQTENILSESDRVLQVNNQQEIDNIFKVQANQSGKKKMNYSNLSQDQHYQNMQNIQLESPEQNLTRGKMTENQQPVILQQEISQKVKKSNAENTLSTDQQIHSKPQPRADSGSRLATQSMKIQELQQLNYERQRSGTQKKTQKSQGVLNADEILKKRDEKMQSIIEDQILVQFQDSRNKIIEATQKNQQRQHPIEVNKHKKIGKTQQMDHDYYDQDKELKNQILKYSNNQKYELSNSKDNAPQIHIQSVSKELDDDFNDRELFSLTKTIQNSLSQNQQKLDQIRNDDNDSGSKSNHGKTSSGRKKTQIKQLRDSPDNISFSNNKDYSKDHKNSLNLINQNQISKSNRKFLNTVQQIEIDKINNFNKEVKYSCPKPFITVAQNEQSVDQNPAIGDQQVSIEGSLVEPLLSVNKSNFSIRNASSRQISQYSQEKDHSDFQIAYENKENNKKQKIGNKKPIEYKQENINLFYQKETVYPKSVKNLYDQFQNVEELKLEDLEIRFSHKSAIESGNLQQSLMEGSSASNKSNLKTKQIEGQLIQATGIRQDGKSVRSYLSPPFSYQSEEIQQNLEIDEHQIPKDLISQRNLNDINQTVTNQKFITPLKDGRDSQDIDKIGSQVIDELAIQETQMTADLGKKPMLSNIQRKPINDQNMNKVIFTSVSNKPFVMEGPSPGFSFRDQQNSQPQTPMNQKLIVSQGSVQTQKALFDYDQQQHASNFQDSKRKLSIKSKQDKVGSGMIFPELQHVQVNELQANSIPGPIQRNKETLQLNGDILSLSRNTYSVEEKQVPKRQNILESSYFLDGNVVYIHEGSTATLETYKNDILRTQLVQSNPFQKQKTKMEKIKQQKLQEIFWERLVRQFNIKLFDKVLEDLKGENKKSMDRQLLGGLLEGHLTSRNETKLNTTSVEQDDRLNEVLMGRFIYKAKGLDKQIIGYYFGQPPQFNQEVCRNFMLSFSFKSISVDQCWRLIFAKSSLPIESQQITRMITVFQDVYCLQNKDNPKINKWLPDTVFFISIKLLDLNTNLHNPKIQKTLRYTKENFVNQSMKLAELKTAFTAEFIGILYDRIQSHPFENRVSLHEIQMKRINEYTHVLTQIPAAVSINKKQQNNSKALSISKTNSRNTKSNSKSKKSKQERFLIFRDPGTIFVKYGRFGSPKLRLVFLNSEETEILWKDSKKEKEKCRSMKISEILEVRIGRDHTAVMRKQEIPADYDHFCLSVVGKNRSLDLRTDEKENPKLPKLWCEKLSQLINTHKNRSHQIPYMSSVLSPTTRYNNYEGSPESPDQGRDYENEIRFHPRDECPQVIEDIWRSEILTNLHKYRNPLTNQLNQKVQIYFEDYQDKQEILNIFEKHKAEFLTFSQQELNEKILTDALHQQKNVVDCKNIQKQKKNIFGCGFTEKFSQWARRSQNSEAPEEPKMMNKLFGGIFNKKETPITIDQLWYRGLPNIARYVLWPILIGNQLELTNKTYNQIQLQILSIKSIFVCQDKINFSKYADSSIQRDDLMEQSQHLRIPCLQLSLIESQRDLEAAAEAASLKHSHKQRITPVSMEQYDSEINIRLNKIPNESAISQVFTDEMQYKPDNIKMGKDTYSLHLSNQFLKVERKIQKIAQAWEEASALGEQFSQIPRTIFVQVMKNVLETFIIYRANASGVNSNLFQLHKVFSQNKFLIPLDETASHFSGMEKIAAPIVLVHLRAMNNFTESAINEVSYQSFIVFTNLVMSSAGRDHKFFLRYFVEDDQSQIDWRMDFFDRLFEQALPQLHRQYKGINMKHEFILHEWLMTLFLNVQGFEGLEFTLRIWDLYLLHGEPILYCIALSILKLQSTFNHFSDAPMQTWLNFIQKIKKLQVPQQSVYFEVMTNQSINRDFRQNSQYINGQQIYERSSSDINGGSVSASSGAVAHNNNEQHEGGSSSLIFTARTLNNQQSNVRSAVDQIIINRDSKYLIKLVEEALAIYVKHNVPQWFREQVLQQMEAEQKNEIYSKVIINDNVK